ncbi:MAG: hypothetical protein ACX939_08865 [Hyphococcus sp.]
MAWREAERRLNRPVAIDEGLFGAAAAQIFATAPYAMGAPLFVLDFALNAVLVGL